MPKAAHSTYSVDMKRLISSSVPLVALLTAACVGVVTDPDESANGNSGGGKSVSPTGRDPGSVTMRRLNRAEYNNTVRDLLGTALAPADDFPADDHGYGFDNIGDVLSISPTQVELYERAAETLIAEALAAPSAGAQLEHLEAETLSGSSGKANASAWVLSSSGNVSGTVSLPSDGTYRVAARVWGQQAGTEPVKVSITVGAQDLGSFDVPNTSDNPLTLEKQVELSAGSKVVSVAFLNDYYNPDQGEDRNLYVDWIEVEGPLGAASGKNSQRDAILICDLALGDSCVRDVLSRFARRAWRRPPTSQEIDGLMQLVAVAQSEGDGTEKGVELALRAVLLSPHFLFRVEPDSSTGVRPLDDWELASRLSYFIWSSMPDEELFELAEQGKLSDSKVLVAQARRMLADEKAEALVDNFAGQWLYTRALSEHEPDQNYFPDFDEALGEAMKQESRLFFSELLQEKHPIETLVQADFAFLNERLADHYGVSGVTGASHQKVALADATRGGVLGQASVLTVTSFPTRTSPVKRGRWVLEQLWCVEVKPPPAGVEVDLPDDAPLGTTLKDQLAQHREDPACATCHNLMDPVGIALENFDGIGSFRDTDNGAPVDPTGVMPGDIAVDGPTDLAQVIASDSRFPACVTQQLFTYALGRGSEDSDAAYFGEMLENLGGKGFSFEELIVQIVQSEPFRMRQQGGGS